MTTGDSLDVFLLGAGASHGSLDCEPETPPLARDLWARLLRRPSFRALLPADLASTSFDFEGGMGALFRAFPEKWPGALQELGLYFAEFWPRPGNLYLQLGRRVRPRAAETVLASLNHEMLLELSLFGSGVPCHYDGTRPVRGVTIMKLHGSANFLPNPPGLHVTPPHAGSASLGRGADPLPGWAPDREGIRVVTDPRRVEAFVRSTGLPPLLSPCVASARGALPAAFLRRFWESWARVVPRARRFTVIGVDLDRIERHVWSPLRSLGCRIDYVGTDPSAVRKLRALAPGAAPVAIVATSFEDYMGSGASQR